MALLLPALAPVHADDTKEAAGRSAADHDHARHAMMTGRALPLAEIIRRLGDGLGGDVVGVVFACDRDDINCRYRFRVISPGRGLREVMVDAATGEILPPGQGWRDNADREAGEERRD